MSNTKAIKSWSVKVCDRNIEFYSLDSYPINFGNDEMFGIAILFQSHKFDGFVPINATLVSLRKYLKEKDEDLNKNELYEYKFEDSLEYRSLTDDSTKGKILFRFFEEGDERGLIHLKLFEEYSAIRKNRLTKPSM